MCLGLLRGASSALLGDAEVVCAGEARVCCPVDKLPFPIDQPEMPVVAVPEAVQAEEGKCSEVLEDTDRAPEGKCAEEEGPFARRQICKGVCPLPKSALMFHMPWWERGGGSCCLGTFQSV